MESQDRKTYSSAWRKWTGWCREQQVNPLSASLDSVLNFLASQFDAGLEYRTLNVYHSALPATHPQIEGFKVREHPLVVQLLTETVHTIKFKGECCVHINIYWKLNNQNAAFFDTILISLKISTILKKGIMKISKMTIIRD